MNEWRKESVGKLVKFVFSKRTDTRRTVNGQFIAQLRAHSDYTHSIYYFELLT